MVIGKYSRLYRLLKNFTSRDHRNVKREREVNHLNNTLWINILCYVRGRRRGFKKQKCELFFFALTMDEDACGYLLSFIRLFGIRGTVKGFLHSSVHVPI